MASVISGDANVSAAEFGYLDGVTSALQTQMDAKLPIAGGKILQIVRATDATNRTTTSTTAVDASLSVTITPQKSDSAVLLLATNKMILSGTGNIGNLSITDSSNNTVSGAQTAQYGLNTATAERLMPVLLGRATPATTSAVTYKLRFFSGNATCTTELANNVTTGQMYAIEVSA